MFDLVVELVFDIVNRRAQVLIIGNKLLGREDFYIHELGNHFSGQRIKLGDPFNLIPPHFDGVSGFRVRRNNLQRVTSHPECSATQFHIIARILDIDQPPQQIISAIHLPALNFDRYLTPTNRVADSVNARYGSNDDHIFAGQQVAGRQEPQPINFIVDLGLFFNKKIVTGHIRFRLIVIVIAHKVRNGVMREKLLKFTVQLSRQRFVVRDNQGWLLSFLDDVRHRKGFPGTGCPQQRLETLTFIEAVYQLINRLGLISHRLKIRNKFKLFHGYFIHTSAADGPIFWPYFD